MRILIVGLGGVTREFRNWPERILATALVRRGHTVFAYGHREAGNPLLSAPDETIDGVRVRRFPPRHRPGRALRRALDGDGPFDVVQLFHPRNVLAYDVGRWCRARGTPMVYTWLGPFHDRYLIDDREQPYDEQPKFERLIFDRRTLLRRILTDLGARRLGPRRLRDHLRNYWLHAPLAWSRALLPCSEHEQTVLRAMGMRQPSRVVPLWIDTAYLRELPPQPVAEYPRPLILYVGQLTRRKAFDLLVDAMPLVLAHHPSATFLFVTHNPEQRERLLALAAERGVSAQIRFLGRLSDAELVAHYRAADLYAFPSRYEGFGLPPLEAMAAGCPVVTSDIPVVSETVQDGVNGVLTRYDDAQDLARGMLEVLGDGQLRTRLIAGGQATLDTRYREEDLVARVEALYEEVRA
jgi:glycogen synthase